MKQLFRILAATILLLLVGCIDDEFVNRLDNLEERVSKLEELCREMNTNISSLQTIVTALQTNDYVTAVTPIIEAGKTVGYTISFVNSDPITIYHGKDGKDGVDGEDGKDGQDGKDGVDGYTPVIGVRQDSDGIYYWTLDGDWLLDDNGNKIKAQGIDGKDGQDGKDGEKGEQGEPGAPGQNGQDGKDGQDGQDGVDGKDGADGITPQLKIEGEYWYISYDNGASWTRLGKATGEDGADGQNGQDGKDGKDGDSFFNSVDTSNEDYVIFTLSDGTQIQLPTWYAFEQLRRMCNEMNTNITALQKLVAAVENRDYITSCTPYMEDGVQLGYTINFAKGNPIVIYYGKDGADGQDGKDGADGKDGIDGYTPVIGVRQDSDGIYYWTLDGDWLLDDNGNKIKAQGIDGNDGQDGKDGADGITPQLKIEGEYWYISYDNGKCWSQLGKATGEDGKDGQNGQDGKDGKDGDSFFKSVTQDEENVYFELADGTVITLPKGTALNITFDEADLVVMSTKSTRSIGYTVSSMTDTVKVEVTSSADIKAKVVADDERGLTGKIHITTGDAIDEYSKVIVFVSNGDKVIMKSILFEEGAIIVQNDYSITFPIEGGSESISFLTNVGFQIKVPDDCTWLTYTQTRSFVEHAIVITASQNDSYEQRYTQIKLIDTESGNIASATIEVIQQCIHISEAVEGEILVQRKGGKVKVKKELQTETIAIPIESEWVKLDVETDDAFYLDISPNSQNEYRQADIKIIGQSGEAIVKILQPGIKYTLQITHTNSTYYIPQVTWDTNSEYLSFISWGDKSINKYTPMSYHEYSNSEEYQQLELYSNILPEQVVLNNITGVTLIDLTNFQANE